MKKGRLFVISGPGGVGKGTIIDEVLEDKSLGLVRGMNITSRPPRTSDRNNPHYIYVGPTEFEDMILTKKIIEYNFFMGNYYGTSKDSIYDQIDSGNHVLMEADINGGLAIKKEIPSAVLIFLYASLDQLETRLRKRGDYNPKQIDDRMAISKQELGFKGAYDYAVENPEDHPEKCVEEVKQIIKKHIK